MATTSVDEVYFNLGRGSVASVSNDSIQIVIYSYPVLLNTFESITLTVVVMDRAAFAPTALFAPNPARSYDSGHLSYSASSGAVSVDLSVTALPISNYTDSLCLLSVAMLAYKTDVPSNSLSLSVSSQSLVFTYADIIHSSALLQCFLECPPLN